MQEVNLSGTDYEIGFQHGRLFGKKLREHVKDSPKESGTIDVLTSYISRIAPEIIAQFKGVAKGAGLSFNEVFLYNIRSLVLGRDTGECANIGMRQEPLLGMISHLLFYPMWPSL